MGHRIGSLILGFATTIAIQGAFALGLGELDLKSNLNQPFNADITLLEVRDLSEAEIKVTLASAEDFDRLGVERNYFLTDISFKVDLDARDGPVVRMRSDRSVREPFLNFVIEARWPSGKLLREYTVLLDLPVFSSDTAAPISPTRTETIAPSTSSTSQPSSSNTEGTRYNPRSSFGSSAANNTPSNTSSSGYDSDSYRVQSSDTLWEIALRVRPDSTASVHQTMLALQQKNPEAFINGNINLLKSGQILRIPDNDDIASVNKRQALQEVASQNRQWSNNDAAAPLEASSANLSTYDDTEDRSGRLSLAAPEDTFDAAEGRISGGTDKSSPDASALEAQLSQTKETLDKTKGENKELRGKISSLEEQIRTLESMIEISNDSLRELELQSAMNDQEQEAVSDSEVMEEDALDTSDLVDSAEQTLDNAVDDVESLTDDVLSDASEGMENLDGVLEELTDDAESSVDDGVIDDVIAEDDTTEVLENDVEEVAASEPETKADRSKVVISAPKKETGLLDTLVNYALYIGLGILGLIAAAVFLLKKRSSEDDDDFDGFLSNDDYGDDDTTVHEPLVGDGSDADSDADTNADTMADEALPDDMEEVMGVTEESELEEEQDTGPEPETEDVVAEADIYIAYGKYDQAEELLLKSLNTNPDHHDARLKLLEIYAAQDNAEGFDPNYAALLAMGASDMFVLRASELREGIAGVSEFDASLYATDELTPAEASLDDALVLTDEPEIVDDDDTSFDLDLGNEDVSATDAVDSNNVVDSTENADIADSLDSTDALLDGLEDTGGLDESVTEVNTAVDDLALLDTNDSGSDDLPELDVSDIDAELSTLDDALDLDLGDVEGLSGDIADTELEIPSDDIDIELEPLDIDLSDDAVESESAIDLDASDELAQDVGDGGLSVVEDDALTDLPVSDAIDDITNLDDLDLPGEVSEPFSETLINENNPLADFEGELEGDSLSTELEQGLEALDSVIDGADELDLNTEELDAGEHSDIVTPELDELDVDMDSEVTFDVADIPAEALSNEGSDSLDALNIEGGETLDIDELDRELEALTSDFSEGELSSDEQDIEIQLDEGFSVVDVDDSPVESSLEGDVEESGLAAPEASDVLDEPEVEFESFDTLENDESELSLDDDITDIRDDITDIRGDGDGDGDSPEDAPVILEEPDLDFDDLDDAVDDIVVSPETNDIEEPNFDFDELPASAETPEASADKAATENDIDDELEFDLPEINPDADDDTDLDFLSDDDEIATKLDLASAYLDMGDKVGAKEIVNEVLAEGNDEQKEQANALLARIEG